MSELQGRHALVTGGGRGIGRAIAARLVAAGAQVSLLGRTESSLREAVAAGAGQHWAAADVADAGALGSAVAGLADRHGPIDLLVANAGAAESAPFVKTAADSFRRMFEMNLMGVVHAAQAVLPGMVQQRQGRIVVIASTAGLKGYAYVSAYCAAKHAAIGLVRAMALEVATSGVTVNAVCPGYTETDMVEESLANIMAKTGRSREEAVAALVKHNPQGRLVAPDEVAATVAFLCSPAAAAITGQAVAVAGGEV